MLMRSFRLLLTSKFNLCYAAALHSHSPIFNNKSKSIPEFNPSHSKYINYRRFLSTVARNMASENSTVVRGAFIVLEGCDRSGKSTQTQMLVDSLNKAGVHAERMGFPDRTTGIGRMINEYIQGDTQLSDQAIHLLFSANRWELSEQLRSKLHSGCTLVVDRYAYSGVAYTAAKGLALSWCQSPDSGLPQPDAVFYLNLSPEAALHRAGYGKEKYETVAFQAKVAQAYKQLLDNEDIVQTIDAEQDPASLHSDLLARVNEVVRNVTPELGVLWPAALDTDCGREQARSSCSDQNTDSVTSADSC